MSEDLTKKLPQSDSEKLTLILLRVDKLEQIVEERFYDTRLIWQKVVADLAHLQVTVDGLEETLRREVGEIKKSLRDIYYRFDVLNNTMLNIQAQHREVDDRVRALEIQHHPPNSQT